MPTEATNLSRQKQTIFGDKSGNCYATCVACMVGVPVEDVPNFCLNPDWVNVSAQWLWERGFVLTWIYGRSEDNISPDTAIWTALPYIVTGKSPRGDFLHCVIHYDGKLLHDPHPSNEGVLDPIRDFILIHATGTPSKESDNA